MMKRVKIHLELLQVFAFEPQANLAGVSKEVAVQLLACFSVEDVLTILLLETQTAGVRLLSLFCSNKS